MFKRRENRGESFTRRLAATRHGAAAASRGLRLGICVLSIESGDPGKV
jgi:hypothetical protein